MVATSMEVRFVSTFVHRCRPRRALVAMDGVSKHQDTPPTTNSCRTTCDDGVQDMHPTGCLDRWCTRHQPKNPTVDGFTLHEDARPGCRFFYYGLWMGTESPSSPRAMNGCARLGLRRGSERAMCDTCSCKSLARDSNDQFYSFLGYCIHHFVDLLNWNEEWNRLL